MKSSVPAVRPAPPRPPEIPQGDPWTILVGEITVCTACPLHRTRTHVATHRGSLSPRVLFVGEAPGREEDLQGAPFVGRAGRRLDEAIRWIGLSAGDLAVINLIKCRPPDNRFSEAAARSCQPFLDRQIDLLRPSWIVPLGAHALAYFDPTAPRIKVSAGTVRAWGQRALYPMLHPAAVLHDPRLRDRWKADAIRLGELLHRPKAEVL